jgi:opacity protein-like surface antigen
MVAFGLSALAGLKFFMTKNWGLYAEYKYNHATFKDGGASSLGPIQGRFDYDAHILVGGLAFHFSP